MASVLAIDFEFTVNLGSLFSPLLLLVVAGLGRFAYVSAIKHFDRKHDEDARIRDERHNENTKRFDRIEDAQQQTLAQTTATNGKVAELDLRMTKEEAKTELLTELMLGRAPDKGA